MAQADIVSYLVFGRPTGDVTTQQAFRAEETALRMTGNLAAGKLEEILAETFHLDTLSIDPGEKELTQGSVSLGKYVTPRVFVIYEYYFEESESPEFDVTYEINQNLSVETQVGNERTSGVDLIWEHEF
jgi:translocation and assembly module TamB